VNPRVWGNFKVEGKETRIWTVWSDRWSNERKVENEGVLEDVDGYDDVDLGEISDKRLRLRLVV